MTEPHRSFDGQADGNIYEYAARSVLALYADFVNGSPSSVLAVVAEHRLPPDAVSALKASAERLGYGRDGIAWISLRPSVAQDAESMKLGEKDLYTIIEGIDPIGIIATDDSAARMIGLAYGVECRPNSVQDVNARCTVALGDFALMLKDPDSKQKAWRLMKHLQLRRSER